MRTRWVKIVGICCATGGVALGCGNHDAASRAVFDAENGRTQVFDGHSRYSIKVYVPSEDGEYELMELSPQNAAYFEENV